MEYGIEPGCSHKGDLMKVGPYVIWLGAKRDIVSLKGYDVVLPLGVSLPGMGFGEAVVAIGCFWPDGRAPAEEFKDLLKEWVLPCLERGDRILAHCQGGHGRTGTFYASLLVRLEPEVKDPVAAVRSRYCSRAIETQEQIEWIFRFKGVPVPKQYERPVVLWEPPPGKWNPPGVWTPPPERKKGR